MNVIFCVMSAATAASTPQHAASLALSRRRFHSSSNKHARNVNAPKFSERYSIADINPNPTLAGRKVETSAVEKLRVANHAATPVRHAADSR